MSYEIGLKKVKIKKEKQKMSKKQNTLKTVATVATIATAIASSNITKADEVLNTTTNETNNIETTANESSSTSIKEVNGVTVSNGTAIVTETPTSSTVEEAKQIQDDAQSAVEKQTSTVNEAENAKKVADENDKNAQADLENVTNLKKEATEEKIASVEKTIEETKNEITSKAEAKQEASKATTSKTEVLKEKEAELANSKESVDAQTKKVEAAKTNKNNTQKVLDGTGATEIINNRDEAKKESVAKKAIEKTAQQALEVAKQADLKKSNDLTEAKAVKGEKEAKLNDAQNKFNEASSNATTKISNLENAKADKAKAQDDFSNAEAKLNEAKANKEVAEKDANTKAQLADAAKTALEEAKTFDADKATKISELTQAKNEQNELVKQANAELANATAAAQEAKENKEKADKAVETLNKQISAIKNLTIPQLPQDVIDAYKAYLADDSDANKTALNNIIQKWFTGSKYDFGTPVTEYSPEHQNVFIKDWSNKDIVLPIDDSEVDLDNLTDKQIEALSQYYALLSNNLQDQVWGSHHYIVTEEAVQGVKNIAKAYADENKPYSSSHSDTALAKDGLGSITWAGENMNFNNTLLGYGAYYSEAKETRKATMSQLYREVYDSVISFITNDVHAYFGHMKLMIGEKAPTKTRAVGAANSFTANGVGRMHFIEFKGQDAHLEYVKDEQTGEYHYVNVDDYYDKGIAKPLATPFDTSKMESELKTAKETQSDADAKNTIATNNLSSATATNKDAGEKLSEIENDLNTQKSIEDKTPSAQAKYDLAVSEKATADSKFDQAKKELVGATKDFNDKKFTLESATATLENAEKENEQAQAKLNEATQKLQVAKEELEKATAEVQRLEAIKDETPEAQKAYDKALADSKEADSKLAEAQKAVDNINADILVKEKALKEAVAEVEKQEATLRSLKEQYDAKASEVATAKQLVEEAKQVEVNIEKEIKSLEEKLQNETAKLESLKNVDKLLEVAKEKAEKASKELEEAVKLYNTESRKLDTLKKDLEDATAQYNAVKAAYEAELLKKAEEERKQFGGRDNVLNPILAGNGEYTKSTTKHEQNIKVNVQASKEFTTTEDVASTQYNANEVVTDTPENSQHKELPKTGELVSVLGFYGLALLGGVVKLKKRDEQ